MLLRSTPPVLRPTFLLFCFSFLLPLLVSVLGPFRLQASYATLMTLLADSRGSRLRGPCDGALLACPCLEIVFLPRICTAWSIKAAASQSV